MTAREPLSVGIPVHNRIRQALNAIVSQTYKHLEIIICDNASDDNTVHAPRDDENSPDGDQIHLISRKGADAPSTFGVPTVPSAGTLASCITIVPDC